ncbi:hypothetical protein IMZ48_44535, partial [Candidatus Bathyarchaeota archaeon]|nr:hypothetical protein [Candidatus Bathyarchaeota archaeon]
MPAANSEETFHTILSFYSLTPEGDSLVSDETLEGLGTSRSLLYVFFGSIIRLFARPDPGMRSTAPVHAPPPTREDAPGIGTQPTTAAEKILQPAAEQAHPRSIGGTLQDGADPADARTAAMAALAHGSPSAAVDPATGRLHAPGPGGDTPREEGT